MPENIIGNCGKHPGFGMVNCPMCEIDRLKKINLKLIEQQLEIDWEIEADKLEIDKKTQNELNDMAEKIISAANHDKKLMEYAKTIHFHLGNLINAIESNPIKYMIPSIFQNAKTAFIKYNELLKSYPQ